MTGKGSDPRPLSVDRDEFATRWDETFSPRAETTAGQAVKQAIDAVDDEPETDPED